MVETITVDEARSLLMENDITPMSVSAEDRDAQDGSVATMPSEEDDLQEAELSVAEAAAKELAEEASRSFGEGAVGLGVDIVEIERMRRILDRRPAFAEEVFSDAEREYCYGKSTPATHFALRFAAKEAVVKALGTGFSEGIWVRDIEVERAKNGRPSVRLSGRAREVAEAQGVTELSLSMSYTHSDAVACALAVTESAIRATEKRKDPMEELARQFKETRKMLDEL